MFTLPADSDKLARSVQRDYRKAADEYRQSRNMAPNRPQMPAMVRVALVLSGLIVVGLVALQFVAI